MDFGRSHLIGVLADILKCGVGGTSRHPVPWGVGGWEREEGV